MQARPSTDAAGTERSELLRRGRYRARHAVPDEIPAAQALRGQAFFGPDGPPDIDRFDSLCRHVLIEDTAESALVACFRYLWLGDGAAITDSYSAQYYDLHRLAAFDGPAMELGRFCLRPGSNDPDILRLAWAAITALVDRGGARLLFGCASFAGTNPERYAPAFAHLRGRHLAPEAWRVGEKAPERVGFPQTGADARAAMRLIPPLLRTYLGMGGWVSDHAVVDREMNTLHVFTAVEVAAIPPARARALRAIAG
ncbi:MAG: GNAT family N-acetyltransferase [Rhodobacteraceae bacterium]|jgi:putative hemolysin|uniref:L-ornithine N(alpha)-acyltransferase n=1 Tax=Salipiger profundus TaxID=1229727 RepID=A0A1U7D8X9_9RHOB|nr:MULTISPECIES: GNAT family N-acyltransferase [Salipiger]APX24621.1 putative hemolysin [Salipiger profundus]MAB06488.1 GNAT family N-acetyltransferase [Paracoccaceae bacterium]GFZ96618.1 ornithine-acyl-ACP acyltransferase [Salipiger profundus]SFB81233.1 ornithine-acyl[acyl carrier protein] N-acyltransferase [Salipiger profundus]